MASYTMQLRTYIESFSQYDEGLSTKERIEIGRKKLFDFDYPIFDEAYRKVFETHFIRKFYMREIGFETEELFKFYLETWLSINMPYFNRLFESELIKFDPLINSEMNVEHKKKVDKQREDSRESLQDTTVNSNTQSDVNSTGETITDDFDRKISSNNPDGRLNLTANDGEGVIEYASEIDEHNFNNKENSQVNKSASGEENINANTHQDDNLSSNINEIEDFIQHRYGKIGVKSYSKLVMEYRQSFLRIENMIHNEMNELFMLVY